MFLLTQVYAEGHLMVDFTADEYMRIRLWHFAIRSHVEYIPKQFPMQNPTMIEDFCKNVTRQGLTSAMLNYLKMCVIFEPMKELMSRQRTYNMEPRDCLRNYLFMKWQKTLNPPVDNVRPQKRPKNPASSGGRRKNSTSGGGGAKKKFPQSDVMMVGEPTLMGSDFGERMITRLENNQFANSFYIKSEDHDGSSNFPNISPSSSTPQQWQQQTNQINPNIVKNEITDTIANSPHVTTS